MLAEHEIKHSAKAKLGNSGFIRLTKCDTFFSFKNRFHVCCKRIGFIIETGFFGVGDFEGFHWINLSERSNTDKLLVFP